MTLLVGTLSHALMITGFVLTMMVLIEYINVQTRGWWQEDLKKSGWKQYAIALLLGASPGCLGAFTVVSLYAHGAMSFGALVGAMIATSGDESFVMLAMFPGRAVILAGALMAIGWLMALVTDRFLTGLVPESGPHMAFVTLYAEGILPVAILVASSVVQDGHGTLPLLAVSKRAFVILKLVNLAAGLGVGWALLLLTL